MGAAAAGKQKHTLEAYVCVGGAEHKNAACELASAWDAKLRALETREGTMHCKAGDFFLAKPCISAALKCKIAP
jgi:hypothetical protein